VKRASVALLVTVTLGFAAAGAQAAGAASPRLTRAQKLKACLSETAGNEKYEMHKLSDWFENQAAILDERGLGSSGQMNQLVATDKRYLAEIRHQNAVAIATCYRRYR
jgi:hypothetical protein